MVMDDSPEDSVDKDMDREAELVDRSFPTSTTSWSNSTSLLWETVLISGLESFDLKIVLKLW